MFQSFFLLCFLLVSLIPANAITKEALADSLTRSLDFVSCVPPVKIQKMIVKGSSITLHTNRTLSCKPMTTKEVYQLRLQVSRWVLGNDHGKVTIYTDKREIKELVISNELPERRGHSDLSGRHIALWASHGIYYNQNEDRWKLQRATLWTTVEDVFSNVYARYVVRMLENANATVYQPRGQIGDSAAMAMGKSGYPRWAESARYWLQYTGVPDSIWHDTIQNDCYKDDLKSRPRWVNWLCGGSKVNPKQPGLGIPIDMALALHTDGYMIPYDTAMVGTLAIYCDHDLNKKNTFPTGQSRMSNRQLAHIVQSQVVNDIRATDCPDWPRRELFNAEYYEARCPQVPSLLLEMLSHIQMRDMHYGLDPAFQFRMARSIYKGVGRWLEGESFVVQPLPVHAFGMNLDEEGLTLHWKPTVDSLESSAAPESYLIEEQIDDSDWQEAGRTQEESLSLAIEHGKRYQFRVTAYNKGGSSFPSQVLSAYLSPESSPCVLIVNAFDTVRGPKWYADTLTAGIVRGSYAIPDGISYHYIGEQMDYDRTHVWISDDECGWGMCYRDQLGKPVVGNTHDYAAQHGRVLQRMNLSYISTSYDGMDSAALKQFDIVDVIMGKEERTDRLDTIRKYSHCVLASGAYIGVIPYASHAGSIISPWMPALTVTYPILPDSERLHAEYVSAFTNGQAIARYADTRLPAAVYMSVNGNTINTTDFQPNAVILWGVPLESLSQFESVYQQSIEKIIH